MKRALFIGFCVVAVLACGSSVPSSAPDARPIDTPVAEKPSDDAPPREQPTSALTDVPLFYATIEVGAIDGMISDAVRAAIVVREYGALEPGGPIALAPGEALVLNEVPLVGVVADDGSPAYAAEHVPEAPDGRYRFAWTRPSGTLAFAALSVPRLSVSLPTSITAETPFDVTTVPASVQLRWKSNSACAERRVEAGFEGTGTSNILTLLTSPCEADLAFTSETNWDAAFVDPSSDAVIGRGHVSIVTRSLAWRRVSVVP
jgi:hypothetical protein